MNQNNRQIILLVVFIVVLALGIGAYFVITSDDFDDRMEAGFPEDVETDIPEEEFDDLENDLTDEAPLANDEASLPDEVEGDITGDGKVTMQDFRQFKEDMETFEQSGWSEELSRSDLTENQQITMEDYQQFRDIFSETQ